MRAAIYNPYLDTLGGGEKYTVSFGKVLSNEGYKVDIWWKTKNIIQKLENRFDLDLRKFNVVEDIKRGDGYDVVFWVSDGSIPLLWARRNFLHFQFPFKNVNGKSLINKMKLFRIEKCICNSYFTKSFIDAEYGISSVVIYPPVETDKFKPKIKDNIILFVGRFSQLTQAKNQHVLIDVFKKISKGDAENWKLVLAGGTEIGADEYIKILESAASKKNIEIVKSPNFSTLKDIYGRAKIFWSAVGYKANIGREPQKAEHFGITAIEAMSSGIVPLVFDGGGYKEIIIDGVNGYLWRSESELARKTRLLFNDAKLMKGLARKARSDALVYETGRFEAEVLEILKG